MRRLRTMRSLSSLRERNCARRRARVRATRWHRRENHESSMLILGLVLRDASLRDAPQDEVFETPREARLLRMVG